MNDRNILGTSSEVLFFRKKVKGKRKLNTREPVSAKGMPACPEWLLPESKQEWNRLCEKLNQMGVLTEFGLIPSARSRIMAESVINKDDEDEMEALLGAPMRPDESSGGGSGRSDS